MGNGTHRLSNEEGRKLLQQMANGGRKGIVLPSPAPKGDRQAEGPKKHKYGAVEEIDETGKKAKSKLQAKHEAEYRLMLREGLIACYCPEVEISLKSPRTGGIHTYKCDHLLVHWDGRLEYIDSKGAITPEFKKKANWMERQFLPRMPHATFKARYAGHAHTYEAKPPKSGKK
jgi:hypothetical protein